MVVCVCARARVWWCVGNLLEARHFGPWVDRRSCSVPSHLRIHLNS
eukprot:COSAG03_NODE_304_length_9180_cov_78.498293_8_plen_46_part_00